MVENKMLDAKKVENIKKAIVGSVYIHDIMKESYEDASGNSVEITLLFNDKFISDYQGRIYVDNIFEAFKPDGEFKYDLLWEYVSEAFGKFVEDPDALKAKDIELYNLIKEAVK